MGMEMMAIEIGIGIDVNQIKSNEMRWDKSWRHTYALLLQRYQQHRHQFNTYFGFVIFFSSVHDDWTHIAHTLAFRLCFLSI